METVSDRKLITQTPSYYTEDFETGSLNTIQIGTPGAADFTAWYHDSNTAPYLQSSGGNTAIEVPTTQQFEGLHRAVDTEINSTYVLEFDFDPGTTTSVTTIVFEHDNGVTQMASVNLSGAGHYSIPFTTGPTQSSPNPFTRVKFTRNDPSSLVALTFTIDNFQVRGSGLSTANVLSYCPDSLCRPRIVGKCTAFHSNS
jgi:hypothetical protein